MRLFVARLRQGHFDHDPAVNQFANIPPRCVCGSVVVVKRCVCGWVGCGEGAPLDKLWHAVGRRTLLGSTAATEQRNSALGGVLRENTTSQHSSASRRQAAILRSAEFFSLSRLLGKLPSCGRIASRPLGQSRPKGWWALLTAHWAPSQLCPGRTAHKKLHWRSCPATPCSPRLFAPYICSVVGQPAHINKAIEVVRKGIVLLKNLNRQRTASGGPRPTLPLRLAELRNITVVRSAGGLLSLLLLLPPPACSTHALCRLAIAQYPMLLPTAFASIAPPCLHLHLQAHTCPSLHALLGCTTL